jgi:acid phosphatase type 7
VAPFCNYTFAAYLTRFHPPSASGVPDANSLFYSVNMGLVHLVMLQGYCPSMKTTLQQPCLAPGSAQIAWLTSDLKRVDRAITPWVVVAFHQPFVNSNMAHSMATEGAPMQAAIESLLYGFKVDLVLSGHVHAVERSARVFQYNCVPDAPTYITIGDGGNREGLHTKWMTPQPSWSIFRQSSFGHGELTATNATHMKWEWRQNPGLSPPIADSVWLIKSDPGPACGTGRTLNPMRSGVSTEVTE